MAMPTSYPKPSPHAQYAFALPPQLVADMDEGSSALVLLRAALHAVNPVLCAFYMDEYLPALRRVSFPNPAPRAVRKVARQCAEQVGASHGWSGSYARRLRTVAESILVCVLTHRDIDATVQHYRDMDLAREHRYRAQQRHADGEHTQQEWRALCDFFHNRCLRCGRSGPLALDHVIPLSKGGADHIGNAQPLCRSCNSFKRDRLFDYRPTNI
jgi:5-methylcytosine-specific restriction endonuclease McrA